MKLITLCTIFCWLSFNAFSQVDTTKKPIDTIPRDSGSARLTDTLMLHAMDSPAVQKVEKVQLTPQPIENGKHEVYRIRPGIDWPLVLSGTAFSLYGFSVIYNKDKVPEATILNLRKSDINGFDRWAADVYSSSAA